MNKTLIFCSTNNIKTGTGIVVHNLEKELGQDHILILSEDNDNTKNRINAVSIMKRPAFPSKGERFFRWLYFFRFPEAIRECIKIINDYKPDKLMVIYPNEYYLLLASIVARKRGLPLITWFHNSYVENRKGIDLLLAKWIQRKVFHLAEKILTISDGLTNYYRTNYHHLSHKFETLQHGFPQKRKTQKELNGNVKTGKIKFAYTGSLNSSCLDASKRLFRALSKIPRAELHIFSGYPKTSFEAVIPKELTYTYYGFLEEEVFVEKIGLCDYSLIAHGFTGDLNPIEYRTIFPTRTIPLLQMGIPIIVHSPQEAFFTEFMVQNKCGLVLTEKNIDNMILEIEKLHQSPEKKKEMVDQAFKTSSYFNIENTAKKLLDYLNITT